MTTPVSTESKLSILSFRLISLSLPLVLWSSLAVGSSPYPAWSEEPSNKTIAKAVDAIGMTVSDMDQAIDFYTNILPFERLSDVEVWGSEYERLQGIFGIRMRVVRLKLGDQFIDLTEYLTPKGRPIPIDSRSNDKWFQHIAIVVNDIDDAVRQIREGNYKFVSSGVMEVPENKLGFRRGVLVCDPDGHVMRVVEK